jgi:hypothetical protein
MTFPPPSRSPKCLNHELVPVIHQMPHPQNVPFTKCPNTMHPHRGEEKAKAHDKTYHRGGGGGGGGIHRIFPLG